jgi:hypothetical protein
MIHMQFQDPRLAQWQGWLARMPRWVWIALFIGVVIPLIVLGIGLLAVALVSAIVVVTLAGLILFIKNRIRRLRRPADDGRRNVRIVVHSARVIDP